VYPQISPQQARDFLKKTARDIFTGKSSLSTGGNQANVGVDLATGSGLADAFQATMMAAKASGKTILNSTQLAQQQPEEFLVTNQIQTKEIIMDSILRSKLGDIIWEFDKVLQEMMDKNPQMQKVELSLSDLKFVSRSPSTIAAATLRKTLDDTTKDIKLRLSASEGLLKIGYYQEAVLKFLTETALIEIENIDNIDNNDKEKSNLDKEKSNLRDRAIKALGEISSDSTDTYSSGNDKNVPCCMHNGYCVKC
ncbi:MAG: hypothetical protein O4859_01190, partial [Trichodesmium sp. St18_bin1]|nr:hypothetical protein [Trichodesmium sp. St18_bin1]